MAVRGQRGARDGAGKPAQGLPWVLGVDLRGAHGLGRPDYGKGHGWPDLGKGMAGGRGLESFRGLRPRIPLIQAVPSGGSATVAAGPCGGTATGPAEWLPSHTVAVPPPHSAGKTLPAEIPWNSRWHSRHVALPPPWEPRRQPKGVPCGHPSWLCQMWVRSASACGTSCNPYATAPLGLLPSERMPKVLSAATEEDAWVDAVLGAMCFSYWTI